MKALIVQGGWQGHEPGPVSEIFAKGLRARGFEVEVSDTLDAFRDLEALKSLDLIVPLWTMGSIEKEQLSPLLEAVKGGVGVAGVHGGMGDSFRQEVEFQFMVGGQWVAHPGNDGITYMVNIVDTDDPIVAGMHDFRSLLGALFHARRSREHGAGHHQFRRYGHACNLEKDVGQRPRVLLLVGACGASV